jgi:hypothetical protein
MKLWDVPGLRDYIRYLIPNFLQSLDKVNNYAYDISLQREFFEAVSGRLFFAYSNPISVSIQLA